MIRVNILNASGVFAYKDFELESDADAYISEVDASKHWGVDSTFAKEDITTQVNLENRINSLVSSGLTDEEACKKCIHLIGGYNKEKQFSKDQIIAMIASFSTISYCLNNNMPTSAKGAILAINPDEVIVTTELKTLLLEILKAY